jgi:hypothetical protein
MVLRRTPISGFGFWSRVPERIGDRASIYLNEVMRKPILDAADRD